MITAKPIAESANFVTLQCTCPGCGKVTHVHVHSHEWYAYQTTDILIQDAFPTLTPSQRELLISGMCDPCWSRMSQDDGSDDE